MNLIEELEKLIEKEVETIQSLEDAADKCPVCKEQREAKKDDVCGYHGIEIQRCRGRIRAFKQAIAIVKKHMLTTEQEDATSEAIRYFRDVATHGEAVEGGSDYAGLSVKSKLFKTLSESEEKLKAFTRSEV